jgi:hypothetical protein
MKSKSRQHMQLREKVIAFGHVLVALLTAVAAAGLPGVRAPLLALGVAAVAQIPIWMSAPMTWGGKPPRILVSLEGALGVASVFAWIFASAWFVVPAITTVMTTAGLLLARRAAPTVSPQRAADEVPAKPPRPTTMSGAEFRELHPALNRFGLAFMTFFLSLAALCVLMAFDDPAALVGVAACAGLAAVPRFGDWVLAKTMPPSQRRELERRSHERAAARARLRERAAARRAGEPLG